MTDRIDENPPMSIPEQAAEWLLRWHCGDLSIAERFEYLTWLKTSPVHIAETLRMCRLYSWLENTKLNLFITNEDTFSNVVELPPREREADQGAQREPRGIVEGQDRRRSGGDRPQRSARARREDLLVRSHVADASRASGAACRSVTAALSAAAPYTRLHHDIGDDQRADHV